MFTRVRGGAAQRSYREPGECDGLGEQQSTQDALRPEKAALAPLDALQWCHTESKKFIEVVVLVVTTVPTSAMSPI